jgi:hypothetical protein
MCNLIFLSGNVFETLPLTHTVHISTYENVSIIVNLLIKWKLNNAQKIVCA